VSDDPHFAGYRPPTRQRRPGELLWTIVVNHLRWTAELMFRGEGYGWECQFFRETDFRYGRRFILKEEAIG
jgi:hypothetical protein